MALRAIARQQFAQVLRRRLWPNLVVVVVVQKSPSPTPIRRLEPQTDVSVSVWSYICAILKGISRGNSHMVAPGHTAVPGAHNLNGRALLRRFERPCIGPGRGRP